MSDTFRAAVFVTLSGGFQDAYTYSLVTEFTDIRAIWVCCGLLLVSFALMFIREDLEENPVIEKDLVEIRQETREIDHALKQELEEEHRELKGSTHPEK